MKLYIQLVSWFKEWYSLRTVCPNGLPNAGMGPTIQTVSMLVCQHLIKLILIFAALSQEFIQNATQLLITRFMPLNPADLQRWLADPEEWLNVEDKENDQWEFEIRVGAVSLFYTTCYG